MHVSISDQMISDFLSGLVAVLALVAVGCTLALMLGGMARRFPFSRLALVLSLAPMSFARFLEPEGSANLHLYAMIVILLGITIDGISHLLEPKVRPNVAEKQEEEPAASAERGPGVIVWEKAQ
jgi:hypothetical protein